MRAFKLPIPGSQTFVVLSSDNPRPKKVYENGKPTDVQAVFDNGRPIFTVEGMVAINGNKLGNVRIESPVSDIPDVPLNALFVGKGEGILQVSPQDEFNLRVTVALPDGFEVAK